MGKIKRDGSRIDIAKLKTSDTSGIDLSDGCIIKSDKLTESDGCYFQSPRSNTNGQNAAFQYEYPADIDLFPQQAAYSEQYENSFQSALSGNNFADPQLDYRNYVNTQSFIDCMIMAEVAKIRIPMC